MCHLDGANAAVDDARDGGLVTTADVEVEVVEQIPREPARRAVRVRSREQDVLLGVDPLMRRREAPENAVLHPVSAGPDVGHDDRDTSRLSDGRPFGDHESAGVERRLDSRRDLVLIDHALQRQSDRGIGDLADPRPYLVRHRHLRSPIADRSSLQTARFIAPHRMLRRRAPGTNEPGTRIAALDEKRCLLEDPQRTARPSRTVHTFGRSRSSVMSLPRIRARSCTIAMRSSPRSISSLIEVS